MDWISVDDKLPKSGERVKIKNSNGNVFMAYPAYADFDFINGEIIPIDEEFDGWLINSGFENPKGKVTHWKPIDK